MEKNNLDEYTFIKKCDDSETLIDFFYEQLNTKNSIDSFPICINIVNKIKSMKSDYNEEEQLLFVELRNLYIFNLAELNKAMFALKFNSVTNDKDSLNNKIFLGFNAITKKYDNDSKDFVCKKMLNDIFNNTFPNYKFNVEADIHLLYGTKEKLLKKGVTDAMLKVIGSYDPFLADYVSCNINLLKGVQDKIDYIIDNYEIFENENEINRYKFLMEEIKDYCKEHEIDEEENLLRLAAEYHFIDKVIDYSDEYSSEDYCKIKDIVTSANRNEIDFNYMTLRRLVETYLKTRIVTQRITDKKMSEEYRKKLDDFVIDYKELSEDEKIYKALDLFNLAKTNDEFDIALKYIDNNIHFNNKKILDFKPKKELK